MGGERTDNAAWFDFYGLTVRVESEREGIIEDVRRDFSYFGTSPREAGLSLRVLGECARPGELPPLGAALQTPRNTVYRTGDVSYLDYFGRALTVCTHSRRHCDVYCDDRDLAHEIAFLTVLSEVGQRLDRLGLHRLHALGVEVAGRAVLVLLPTAGGKTTLALELLRTEGVRLISEDSPLLSRSGWVCPFPLRIGVRAGAEPADVPERYVRTVRRMEHGPKTLIDIEHFADRVAAPCPPGAVLLGRRRLSGPSSIVPVGRRRAIGPFLRNCVVGLGLYQGVEFVFQRSPWEIAGKAGVALSRLWNSLRVIGCSRVYDFALGPDPRQSAAVLAEFLRGPALET